MMIDALLCKNASLNMLLMKSKKYSFCKRNIFLVKTLLWDSLASDLSCRILNDELIEIDCLATFETLNKKSKKILIDNKLANAKFVDFFFAFHFGLGLLFMQRLAEAIKSSLSKTEKIERILEETKEILNITRIELEGLDLNCEILGDKHICEEQPCRQAPNIITLIVTHELLEHKHIFENIIESIKKYFLSNLSRLKIILDYRNICEAQKRHVFSDIDFLYYRELSRLADVFVYRCECLEGCPEEVRKIKTKKELKALYKRGKDG